MSDRDNKDLQRITSFQQELASDPSSLVFIALAETLNRQKRFEEAASVAADGLRYHEDSVSGHLALAVALAGTQDIHGSIERIKTALSLDNENPKALALMGTLLLEKGLAHRSVQFFQQAVRAAPERQEYQELLRRARRLSQFSQNSRPAIANESPSPGRADPWKSQSVSTPAPGHELIEDVEVGTEFEVDRSELFSNDESATIDQARLEDLKPVASIAEATQYASVQDMLGDGELSSHYDAFSSTPLPNTTSKLRMGGSAAQPEHPLTKGAVPNFQDISDLRTRALPQELATGVQPLSEEQTPTEKPATNRQVQPSFEAPSVRRDREKAKSDVKDQVELSQISTPSNPSKEDPISSDVSNAEPFPSDPSLPEKKIPSMESHEKSEKHPRKKSAPRGPTPIASSKAKAPTQDIVVEKLEDKAEAENRPATMFVDDAVWAIYGADRPEPKPTSNKKENEQSKTPKKQNQTDSPNRRRRSVLVVRTSEVFGKIIKGLAVGIAVILSTFGGFQLATRNSSTANAQFVENVRGVVSDINTGSLSSLNNALEVIGELSENDPKAAEELSDARAEIQALLWSRYGKRAKNRDAALAALALSEDPRMSLETIHARIIMNKLTWRDDEIDNFLSDYLENYPEAIKPRLLRSKLAAAKSRDAEALENLVAAYQLDPTNREVLLQLANWEGRSSNYRSMLRFLEQILEQDAYRDDVEALLNSVVLSQILGDERKIARLQSRLVGVVRDEGIAVAKDEIGRASLVFAVLNLISQDLEQALENLESSEMTYANSFDFKLATASAWFLTGNFSKAKKQIEAAQKLQAKNLEAMLLASRIEFAQLAEIKFSSGRIFSSRDAEQVDHASTRFGRVTLVPSRFTFLEFEFNGELFPERAYARLAKQFKGEALDDELFAANIYHAAKRFQSLGKHELARKLLLRLAKRKQSPQIFASLGTTLFHLRQKEQALLQFDKALDLDSSNVEAALGKAKILAEGNDFLAALEVIENNIPSEVIAPTLRIFHAGLHKVRGSDAKELELLSTLKEYSSGSSIYLTRYGRSLHANGKRSQALAAYSKALTVNRGLGRRPLVKKKGREDSRNAVDYLYLGRALAKKSVVRAKQMLNASIKAQDTPEEAHYFLGELLMKKRATRRKGKRSLKLYLRNMPSGEYARDAKRLIRRK
ncbi:MAG: hypothetical protein VYC39_07990 [Myxococcota bacterium]|nr:hypothetical protein [Myxococcota bacterium]